VRVITGGSDEAGNEELSVTVGPFQSDTDEAERERERHETRRLLYVALTRARDRLYLSTTLKKGVVAAGRGSLAEVLPDSLKALFAHAATGFAEVDTVGWTGASGHEYVWRLCRAVETAGADHDHGLAPAIDGERAADDFDALAASGPPRVAATALARRITIDEPAEASRSERVLGVLIHRLFEIGDRLRASAGIPAVLTVATRALALEDVAVAHDGEAVVSAAVAAWTRASEREDVAAALSGISRIYEVPFSMVEEEDDARSIVRGTIDCLVCKAEGRDAVVELKTGRPASAHARQLELYVRAARALLPGAAVEGILLYV
jgi:ATP-dependent helicase/nuclease subunit A